MEVKRVNIDEITPEQFYEEHWKPGIPLVFKNASSVWKAKGTFTPDWFRKNFGTKRKIIGSGVLPDGKVVDRAEHSLNELLDLMEGKVPGKKLPYPCTFDLRHEFTELLPYVTPINLGYAQPNWLESTWFSRGNWGNRVELFLGGPGGQFPYIHLDYYHLSAWVTQLYGRKEFTVYPRGQEKYLYPDPNNTWLSLIEDQENPDPVKYPLYKHATPIRFVMGPGETLYIPVGIWHTAKSLEPTLSVAFDLLNKENFPLFIKDVWNFRKERPLKAAAVTSYAAFAGLMCRAGDACGVRRNAARG